MLILASGSHRSKERFGKQIDILILIGIITLVASCANPETTNNTTEEQRTATTYTCLDTTKLEALGITYDYIESRSGKHKLRLCVRDTLSKSDQIDGITYYYRGNGYGKDCNPLFQLDSFAVSLQSTTQVIACDMGFYLHAYEPLLHPDIVFDDFNFDHFIDISLLSGTTGNSHETRDYYIYNSETRKFNKPIRLTNASFNSSTRLVTEGWNGGHAGRIGGQTTYRYSESDSLIMIRSEQRKYVREIDSYTREVKTLENDGTYSITRDTVRLE